MFLPMKPPAHPIRLMRNTLFLSLAAMLALPAFQATAKVEVLLSGGNGKADEAVVTEPFSVDFDSTGTPWGVEFVNGNRVFKIDAQGKVEFIAGQFWTYSEKGPVVAPTEGKEPKEIVFRGMHDIAINAQDEAFIADSFGHKIRKMNLKTHEVTTIAGGDGGGFAGDGGPSVNAKLSTPICGYLSTDQKTLFVADIGNSRIRALDLIKGTISTVAGNGKKGVPTTGAKATESPLSGPRACCVSKDGTLYIVQREGNSLASVKDGVISMVVNARNQKGYAGDGGPAKDAKLNGPKYVCMDPQDRVIICDTENHCVRRFDPVTGQIELLAGAPTKASKVIGNDLLSTGLKRPHGVRFDRQGRLYILDTYNDRILRSEYR